MARDPDDFRRSLRAALASAFSAARNTMTDKVFVVATGDGSKSVIVTEADSAVVLLTGHLIFRRGVEPVGGYAPGRWTEFVEVTDPASKARLRGMVEGGAGSA